MITVKTPVNKLLIDLTNLTGDELKKAKRENGQILNKSKNFTITDEYINDAKALFTINDMIDAIDEGGEVFGLWAIVKIADNNMNNLTPVGLVNSIKPAVMSQPQEGDIIETFVPEELEPERQSTWAEWVNVDSPNISVTEHEGFTYFGAHLGNKGECLKGNELIVIHNCTDCELVTSYPAIEEI